MRPEQGAYAPLDAGPSTSDYKLRPRPPARAPGARTSTEQARSLKRLPSTGFKAVLPHGVPQGIRQKDKFVPLPLDSSRGGSPGRQEEGPDVSVPDIIAAGPAGRARITVYCISESLDQEKLQELIRIKHPTWETHSYEDVIHARLPSPHQALSSTGMSPTPSPLGPGRAAHLGGGSSGAMAAAAAHTDEAAAGGASSNGSNAGGGGFMGGAVAPPGQDIFFFEYGVVAFWGLEAQHEAAILKTLARAVQQGPLEEPDVDEFVFNISVSEPPHIQNDTITINRRQAADHQVRLAISHALAQSTKLSVYEERVVALVEESKHLPQDLASQGRVSMSTKKLAQLIGKVFLQSSTLNLLSTVMDTPEFFWSAPDQLQALYDRACEYLELDTRAEVLNARFEVLQEMLDMLRDHKNNRHAARLEWIIIWLLVVDVLLMLFQLLGLFGLV